jgi:hypothetical protein
MPISYINAAKAPSWPGGSSGNTSSITISKPTNTADGDVMIAFIVTGSGAVVSDPGGWTLIGVVDNSSTGASNLKSTAWYKVAASEGASYNFTDDSGGTLPMNGCIATYRGVDTTNPINISGSAITTTADPVTTPTVTTTAPCLMVHFATTRNTTTLATQGTYTNGAGQTERMNPANRGNTTAYFSELSSSTAATIVSAGSQTGVTFDSVTHTPTNGIQWQIGLKEFVTPATPAAGAVAATATAYDAASLTVTSTATVAAATATAYNATVLTGVAAENTGSAGAVVTAYDAAGWVIHPVNVGVQAFNASVDISTEAGYAQVSAAALDSHGYFGAPESRRWTIPAEDRSWTIEAESRVWTIPSED